MKKSYITKQELIKSLQNLKDIPNDTPVLLVLHTPDKKNIYPVSITDIQCNESEIYLTPEYMCTQVDQLEGLLK